MKKVFGIAAVIMAISLFSTAAMAQWGGGKERGVRVTHRSAIASADTWMATAPTSNRAEETPLSGYDTVRADFDVTGTGISIVCNLQCSNDSIWVSGDSITLTRDTYKVWDLGGCKNYYTYIESVSASDSVTVYLQPYNK